MSTFQVPYSSSPAQPSTPDAATKRTQNPRFSSSLASHPSTTPLGPPPSSAGSFTPAGPPPSSLLGSSQLDDEFSKRRTPAKQAGSTFSPGQSKLFGSAISRGGLLNGRSTQDHRDELFTFDQSMNGGRFDFDDAEADRDFAFPSLYGSSPSKSLKNTAQQTLSKLSSHPLTDPRSLQNSVAAQNLPPLRGAKRSRTGQVISPPHSLKRWYQSENSVVSGIAKDLSTSMKPAALTEPYDFITALENCLQMLRPAANGNHLDQAQLQININAASYSTCLLLDKNIPDRPKSSDPAESLQIGPGNESSPLLKASWLSVLVLRTHCVFTNDEERSLHLSFRENQQREASSASVSLPRILLDWINQCHNPWVSLAVEVGLEDPSPPAHFSFWDIVLTLILRGRLESATILLRKSDFHHAASAFNEGHADGYSDVQAENIKSRVERVVELLRLCPGLHGDWDVSSNPWLLFRGVVKRSLGELDSFAEKGHEASRSNRRTEASIPWIIHQSLKILHGILLGNETEILASAQDWVEATIGLAVWRKEDDLTNITRSTLGDRPPPLKSLLAAQGFVNALDDNSFYLQRLSWSFERATDDGSGNGFQINTNRQIEVCLACVFEGDYEKVFKIIHGWSLPVTDALLELATAGGWYLPDPPVSDTLMQNFDDDDLMVLSNYGQPDSGALQVNATMIEYASALFKRGQQGENTQQSHSQWQSAISILMRLGDRAAHGTQIEDILSTIKIDSDETMDSILMVCQRCNLHGKGYSYAERYADTILEDYNNYGKALKYYARGHALKKIRNVLDLLISMSLIRSEAFPSQDSLDEDLISFLDNTSNAYESLTLLDQEGATMLRGLMAGYATIRTFYNLRDSSLKTDAAISECRRALLAAIASAADNVDAEVLNEQRGASISSDALLVLLGESLAFLKNPMYTLDETLSLAVTGAMENLQTLPKQAYQRCEDFLLSALAYYHGHTRVLSPSGLLQAMSSMTSGTSFSLVSSSLLESMSEDSVEDIMTDEAREETTHRAWDWRAGLKRDASGDPILRILRLNVAQKLAKHWMVGNKRR